MSALGSELHDVRGVSFFFTTVSFITNIRVRQSIETQIQYICMADPIATQMEVTIHVYIFISVSIFAQVVRIRSPLLDANVVEIHYDRPAADLHTQCRTPCRCPLAETETNETNSYSWY